MRVLSSLLLVGLFGVGSNANAFPSQSIRLQFEDRAAPLLQSDIERQFHDAVGEVPGELPAGVEPLVTVTSLAPNALRLSYRGLSATNQRDLELPSSASEAATLIALAAANLVAADLKGTDTPDTPVAPIEADEQRVASSELASPTPASNTANVAVSAPNDDSEIWRAGLYAGWWDASADVTAPNGVVVGVGLPWVAFLLGSSGRETTIPVDVRLGYSYALSAHLALHAQVLAAWIYEAGTACESCRFAHHKVFVFPSLGVRYRSESGLTAGADINLIGANFDYQVESGAGQGWSGPDWLIPGAFSRLYVGYQWSL